MAGLRSISEVNFHGGHSFSLAAFYSLGFRKEFDAQGYSTCQAGFLPGFSTRRICPTESGVPSLMLRTNINFDMAAWGNLNLATAYAGPSFDDDLMTEPQMNLEPLT